MNNFLKKLEEVSARLNLTGVEKLELFDKALDQAYYATLELTDKSESWSPENIIEAYKKAGALNLDTLGERVRQETEEHEEIFRMLNKVEIRLNNLQKNILARNWPPVMEDVVVDLGNRREQVIEIKINLANSKIDKRPRGGRIGMLQRTMGSILNIDQKIDNILQKDRENQRHILNTEERARQRLFHLINLAGEQNKTKDTEKAKLQQNADRIMNQIKEDYSKKILTSRDVLNVLNGLFESNEEIIDIKNTIIRTEYVQLDDGRFLSDLISRK